MLILVTEVCVKSVPVLAVSHSSSFTEFIITFYVVLAFYIYFICRF